MSAYRHDALTHRTVLIAPNRAGLVPRATSSLPNVPIDQCPFCPGHERETDTEVMRIPEHGPWQVRVVNNRYPLIAQHASDAHDRGRHELVIECTEHDLDWPDFSAAQSVLALNAIQARIQAHFAEASIESVFVFRNRGVRSGSSQPHAHTQIVALPWAPDALDALEANDPFAFETDEACAPQERMVHQSTHFTSIVAYAPLKNHHVRIVPRPGTPAFESLDVHALADFSNVLHLTLRAMRNALDAFDYNLVWRIPRKSTSVRSKSHWHLDIVPRIAGLGAGFELATQIDVITVLPEKSAEMFRAAWPV